MLSAWNAYSTFDRLLDDVMDDVSRSAFGAAASAASFSPATDIGENQDGWTVVLDVPGIKRDQLELTLEGRTLTVKGGRGYEGKPNERVALGRRYGAFTRVFQLPEGIDGNGLRAELADGVLTVHLPKHAAARPRRIEIATGSPSGNQLSEKKSD